MKTSRVLRDRLRSTVILTTKTGESFRGVLFEADERVLVLRNAEKLTRGERSVLVDGELLVLAADVAYVQVTERTLE